MTYSKSILLYPQSDSIGKVDYIDHMGTDLSVVNAARASLNDDDKKKLTKKDKILLKFLWENRHTTPFEKCEITFRFVVPLFCARQHMRARTWSFNEVSRRYTSDEIRFFVPHVWREQHKSKLQCSVEGSEFNPSIFEDYSNATDVLKEHVRSSVQLYNEMLDAGIAREMARMVLPQNMYVKYWGKVNLKNAFDFLRLRLDKHAQPEIQVVGKAMLEIIEDLFPECATVFKNSL